MQNQIITGFYIVAREPGAEHPALPTWASASENPLNLDDRLPWNSERTEIDEVPGAFHLHGILSLAECARMIELTESLGYLQDAAVSLPRSVRHNHNATWVVDDLTGDIIWQRCKGLMSDDKGIFSGKKALGINARFRFYRYQTGDYFKPHTDGAWPGSKVVDRKLLANAYPDRWSQLSFLLFLSDEFEGGHTQFFIEGNNTSQPAQNGHQSTTVNIKTAAGTALCFPHGMHPLHCVHGSEEIISGTKYIIRSDILYEV
jgi:predicted 2-oxoglutarate/Fe(II)-dependent dioxygenase YbiX